MSCSVITVSYYTGPALFAALRSALKQAQLTELIVVDNGNPPVVLTRLQQMALTEPRLKIVTGHGNIGFSAGCNLGAAKAAGEYLLIMNPACLLPPDAIAGMEAGLKKIPGAMLAGCRLENPDGSEWHSGRLTPLTPVTAIGESLGLHRLPHHRRNHSAPISREPFELFSVSDACMFMRREDYNRLHGFDAGFFLYADDLDLCRRIHALGGKVICVPGVQVTRMASGGAASMRFKEWQEAKGLRRYFDKHFRGKYIPGFLALIRLAIIMRFACRVAARKVIMRLRPKVPTSEAQALRRLMILATGLADLPESQSLKNRVVLVTGATGQVGLCITRRLLASGATVLALSRTDATAFRHERLHWIKGDLNDNALNLGQYDADTIVHCVPLWQTQFLTRLVETSTNRIIAFSSTSIFAKALSKNEFEKNVVKGLARAEALLSESCQAKNIALTILRPTMVYGVGLDENIMALVRFIRQFGFFPVYPPAFGRRQPVHADDLAIAVLSVMENEKTFGKAYNISGGEIITYRDILERLFKLLGEKPRIIPTTFLPFAFDIAGLLLRKKDINGEIARRMNDDLIFFHDDATRDFHFSPRPFLSGGMRDIEGF